MTIKTNSAFAVLAGAVALASFSMPAQAQTTDARWLPFVGCWEALGAEDQNGVLCFRPAGAGLELTNYVGGEAVSSEMFVADGARRDVSADGCEGWETVNFSADGRRAFTRTEFVCEGGTSRTGTGVMSFISPVRWADVRALDVDGEQVAWVQEYQLASRDRLAEEGLESPADAASMAIRSSRLAAAAPITLDDVQEGVALMDDKAVETWIVVQRDRFDPTGAELVALADAGVSDAVLDAIVAVSHPDRFLVEAESPIEQYEARADGPRKRLTYRGYMAYDPFWGPRPVSAFGYGYNPFGYGYNPWAYGYNGYGYGYGGARPGYVIIDRQPRNNGGRVYNGRGYRSGSGGVSTGRSAQPRSGGEPRYGRSGPDNIGSGSGATAGPGASSAPPPRRAVRRRGGRGG